VPKKDGGTHPILDPPRHQNKALMRLLLKMITTKQTVTEPEHNLSGHSYRLYNDESAAHTRAHSLYPKADSLLQSRCAHAPQKVSEASLSHGHCIVSTPTRITAYPPPSALAKVCVPAHVWRSGHLHIMGKQRCSSTLVPWKAQNWYQLGPPGRSL